MISKGEKARLAAAAFFTKDANIAKYKGYQLLVDDIDNEAIAKEGAFHPNHLYFDAMDEDFSQPLKEDSFFYFLELIPDVTSNKKESIPATIYFLVFLNWAAYFYKKLQKEYSQKKPYKSNGDIRSDFESAKAMAVVLEDISSDEKVFDEKIELSLEDIKKLAAKKDSKRNFPLKSHEFITLFQLFARGWYDQNFFESRHKKGTIEFAHYATEYLLKVADEKKNKPAIYNDKTSNIDANLKKLFGKSPQKILEYRIYGFHIIAEQMKHPNEKEKFSYSISVSQYGVKHTFYRYAQLNNERYEKPKF